MALKLKNKILSRMCLLLVVVAMISGNVAFADDVAVLATYKTGFDSQQGKDNWYYCWFSGDEINEMVWDAANSRWTPEDGRTNPNIRSSELNTANDAGAGYKFVAPQKGMLRARGEVAQAFPDSAKGNGIIAHIGKGKKDVWSAHVTYGNIQKYDLIIPVREGEEVYFYGDANGNNGYDWFWWRPTVEYLDMEYVPEEEDALYFQKRDDKMLRLKFDEITETYPASDGIAYISGQEFRTSENYTLVKRVIATATTRYRVYGSIKPKDGRNGGTILTIKKNGEKVWSQLFVDDKSSNFDVRMRAEKGDNIDVELDVADYTGYNAAEWKCDVEQLPGTAACTASTSVNHTYAVLDEISLGSLTGMSSENGVKFYSQRFSRKVPMKYDSTAKKWVSGVEGDTGYFTATAAYPGKHYDSVMEYTITKDGILRVDGSLAPEGASDGVLSKIYLNDKVIWSSRVGGERVVRWDEPYDTSYFLYDVNTVANVKAGDTLKFTFNQWRLTKSDTVDLSDVMIKYISGNILSETTKWKLGESIVVDTADKTIRKDGVTTDIDVFKADDTTYMATTDAKRLFGADAVASANKKTVGDVEYTALRSAAEGAGKSVVWAAERLVIVHDGIPVLFSWPELSEIETALEGGVLFD